MKSWRIAELLPEARALYGELEQLLGVRLWHDLPLIRTLFNRGDTNDWLARSGDDGYADYLDDRPDLGALPSLTQPAFGYAGVRNTARVDVGTLVTQYRQRLLDERRIVEAPLPYDQMPDGQDRIVFCEGWRARHNPWFSYLPHGGNKGEVLIVETDAPPLELMFKHRVFLVPIGGNRYWVGATSAHGLDDPLPTPRGRSYLLERLGELLRVPFRVVDHRAAVRPTVRDRRMLIGRHPVREDLFIFNGLGTKGASLAPLGSKWLADHLLDGAPIPPEVNIARFQ